MLIEYIWLDGYGNPRSKTKVTYQKKPEKIEDVEIPLWNYDGSSTGQAEGSHSEIILKPQSVFPDPFRAGDSLMVLCDTYNPDMTPHSSNTRHAAMEKFARWPKAESMFGLEQEFFIMKGDKLLAESVHDKDLEKMNSQGQY